MKPRNTWILAILAVGLFAFIFLFERHTGRPTPAVARVIPGLKPAEVTRVTIQLEGRREIRVERTNGGWRLTQPLVYPAQSDAVERLLAGLAELTPRFYFSAGDLRGRKRLNEEFGFDPSQVSITLQRGDEGPTLLLGKMTAPGDQVYAQTVGTEGVWVVDAEIFKVIPRSENDWRDTLLVDLTNRSFDRIVATNGAKAFELLRDPTNRLWRMTYPTPSRADNPKIEQLLTTLQGLRVLSFQTDDPRADLESFGLQPPVMELTLYASSNQIFSLQTGKSPTNDPNRFYARCNGQSAVVQLPRGPLAPWMDDPTEFRDPHLVSFTTGVPEIIEGYDGDEKFVVRRETNGSWRVTAPFAFSADTNTMAQVLGDLAGMRVVRAGGKFAVREAVVELDFPHYGLAPPARRYILKRNNGAVLAELDFGSVSNTTVFARRPEESSVFAVGLEDFQKLPANAIQLRSRRVWNFTENRITRLTITTNGVARQLIHKGTNSWQVAPGSQGIFDPLTVEAAANDLAELETPVWVARGDQYRPTFGFSTNSTRISMELAGDGGPASAIELEFGAVSPRGLRLAATRLDDGQTWIFVFPPAMLDRLDYCLKIDENAAR